jgi:IPT/TIG domain
MLADTFSEVTSVARTIIWPVVIVVLLVLYRHAISRFLAGMGGRVSRVSFAGASLEFVPASEAPSTMVSAVTEFIDATSTAGQIMSSGGKSLDMAIHSTGADFVKIDLLGGRGWLTSRLYIFSVILSETAGVKKLVLVQRGTAGDESFAGIASPLLVADRLGSRFRWLSYALADAMSPNPSGQQASASVLVRPLTDPQWASGVAERYLTHGLIRTAPYASADDKVNQFTYIDEGPSATPKHSAQVPAPNIPPPGHKIPHITGIAPASGSRSGGTSVAITGSGFSGVRYVRFGDSSAVISAVTDMEIKAISPPGDGNVKITVVTPAGSSEGDDWTTIDSSDGSLHSEHAVWIRNGQHLRSMIGGVIDTTCITETASTKRTDVREQILREQGDFVPVVDRDGQFRRLIDRRAVIDRLARDVAESPS